MENTGFMDYFKFVEFDEEVDLASVSTIEKEFEVLNYAEKRTQASNGRQRRLPLPF